jgi:hypothetical protein
MLKPAPGRRDGSVTGLPTIENGMPKFVPEPEIDHRQLDDARDGEACTGEERQRQRELRHDEPAPHPLTAATAGGTTGFLEDVVEVRSCDLPRRRTAEQHAGDHRHGERKDQDRNVDADVRVGRQ